MPAAAAWPTRFEVGPTVICARYWRPAEPTRVPAIEVRAGSRRGAISPT